MASSMLRQSERIRTQTLQARLRALEGTHSPGRRRSPRLIDAELRVARELRAALTQTQPSAR